jgi:hypothetical protein
MTPLQANLNKIVERKIKIAAASAFYGYPKTNNREDFRNAFTREIFDAFKRAGWQDRSAGQ